jgi:hypothetical protein
MLAIGTAPGTAYVHYPAEVGGVRCLVGDAEGALSVLAVARGLMVRQPLARAGSVLACCDYHAAAAPYKSRFALAPPGALPAGRGAAGRHITKLAFCYALSVVVAAARVTSPVAAFAGVTQRAWDAFARDPGYAEDMARAASGLPVPVTDTDIWTGQAALSLGVVAV